MSNIPNLYANLSDYYDQFCAEINYAEQSAFARRAFHCFSCSEGRDYLDLACGTGAHMLHMQPHGFRQTGLDNSADMLSRAALKVADAQYLLADMADLDSVNAFDLITCFLYSIHYSHPTTALHETLRRAWIALKPGGVFIFNAVDAMGIRRNNTVVTHIHIEDAELRFESGWQYSGSGEVMELNLSITKMSAHGTQCWDDKHRMTACVFPALKTMLVDLGFEVTFLEHDYLAMRPWNGESSNILVVAVKPKVSAH